ncbi:MAG: arsenate reductase ArsC [Limisphaerales bacterium]
MKQRVLFVCIHNSARSQMAEAFLNRLCPAFFEAHSAGLEPGKLNPNVVAVMREAGIDISGNQTKSVHDLLRAGQHFHHIVAVCDAEAAERCPIFPGVAQRQHWPFPDPSSAQGTPEEKLAFARSVRDQIKARVTAFCAEHCAESAAV